MNISNESYEKLLTHTNEFLKKHGLAKIKGETGLKLMAYVPAWGNYRKPRFIEVCKPSRRDQVLKKIYDNPATTKNGRDSLFGYVREFYANIPREYVLSWLQKQENYQLHLIQQREKILRPASEKKINVRWMIDLIDMSKYKSPQNYQRAWILTVIDVFSKYAWARALTTKEGGKVSSALVDIFAENHQKTGAYPKIIQSDNGSEFKTKELAGILQSRGIKHIFSPAYMPQANGVIERFNRTLKGMIFSNFTRNNNTKFYEYLHIFVENYNNTIHSTTEEKPVNVHQSGIVATKQQKLVEAHIKKWRPSIREYPELKVGNCVRIHILTNKEARKKTFAKKYLPQWSKQIYYVVSIFGEQSQKVKPKYILAKYPDGDVLDRRFYRHDLQLIADPN